MAGDVLRMTVFRKFEQCASYQHLWCKSATTVSRHTNDDPDYIFEEYKGHTIASHKNNVVGKDINNLIIVYVQMSSPITGLLLGLLIASCQG